MSHTKHPWLWLTVILLYVLCFPAYCQENWRISEVEPTGDTIRIQYDLETDKPGLLFNITPYYVNGKGQRNKMEAVSGDVGENVTTGQDKLIIWAAGKQLDAYVDSLHIELDIEVMPHQVAISLTRDSYKRAGRMPLSSDTLRAVRYELVDNHWNKHLEGDLEASGKPWNVRLPRSLPLDRQYQIRLWNAQHQAVYTSTFSVQRKIPLGARIGAAGVITGVALYLILRRGPTELPTPYGLPNSSR